MLDFDLVPMTRALMLALYNGDLALAERELNARIHPSWSLPREVLGMRLRQLDADPSWQPWLLQAVVTRDAPTLIGNIGFHGPPGHHPCEPRWPGIVEIGYDIVPDHRRQGLVTRGVQRLIEWATPRAASHVAITTSPINAPSRRIAEKLGFAFVEKQVHPTRGLELLYLKPLDPRHPPPDSE